jgi:hypothetical protein
LTTDEMRTLISNSHQWLESCLSPSVPTKLIVSLGIFDGPLRSATDEMRTLISNCLSTSVPTKSNSHWESSKKICIQRNIHIGHNEFGSKILYNVSFATRNNFTLL